MCKTNSFFVCAEWNYSAAFGVLLHPSYQVDVMFMLKTKSVILMIMSSYVIEPGFYIVLPYCWALMSCDFTPWASLSAGPITHGPLLEKNKCFPWGLVYYKKTHSLSMSDKRLWKILNWNIRGINAEEKWLALANKIEESGCDIICLQETKRQTFDMDYIKKILS
jgi:hypothetical protein